MNDITDWSELERSGHIARNLRAAEHRQAMGLPQALDVRVVEGFIEAFPKRQEPTIKAGITDAEEKNQMPEPHRRSEV